MDELFNITEYPVKDALTKLLVDNTTGKNIIFATDAYSDIGIRSKNQIRETLLKSSIDLQSHVDLQPRVSKSSDKQHMRTKKHAEVFTPSWICNKMNNFCDTEWFGRENVFNVEIDDNGVHSWSRTKNNILFDNGKTWKEYVLSPRLEITCGEAPFLVSRYDTTNGKIIPIENRIGILDRKLRVINENVNSEKSWFEWVYKAFQSTYGYEFQGDSLLIARINLLNTFADYVFDRWNKKLTKNKIDKISEIISWNLWQMDGLTDMIPYATAKDPQVSLFIFDDIDSPDDIVKPKKLDESDNDYCKIKYWYNENEEINKCDDNTITFKELILRMKFDFIIGNPPYHENKKNDRDRLNPLYHLFMEESYKVSDCVLLITPARFLSNAGQTPKKWNEKILSDVHFNKLLIADDASTIFPDTEIKGGVAITIRNVSKIYGKEEENNDLNNIISHVKRITKDNNYFDKIVASQGLYRFNKLAFVEYPQILEKTGDGTKNKIVSKLICKMPELFLTESPSNSKEYVKLIYKSDKKTECYINRKYIQDNDYIDTYNVSVPEANNKGIYGEKLGEPFVLKPGEGTSDTYLSIGQYDTFSEAENAIKYLKSKFLRALLGYRKVTHHTSPNVWVLVPDQDFTLKSDIDWTRSINEIDQQLYKKYGLTNEEIEFIETHVQEME